MKKGNRQSKAMTKRERAHFKELELRRQWSAEDAAKLREEVGSEFAAAMDANLFLGRAMAMARRSS